MSMSFSPIHNYRQPQVFISKGERGWVATYVDKEEQMVAVEEVDINPDRPPYLLVRDDQAYRAVVLRDESN